MSNISIVKIQFKYVYRGFNHQEVMAAAISFSPLKPQYAKLFAVQNKALVVARMVQQRITE